MEHSPLGRLRRGGSCWDVLQTSISLCNMSLCDDLTSRISFRAVSISQLSWCDRLRRLVGDSGLSLVLLTLGVLGWDRRNIQDIQKREL